MKSYYITTQPAQDERHEVHKVGCSKLPMERRYIGEFDSSEEALSHVRHTHTNATNCRHCGGNVTEPSQIPDQPLKLP